MATLLEVQPPQVVVGIVVVGFHHSKGSIVEFVHPKNLDVTGYKHLVHQALPDGAHNVDAGTVCFILRPSGPNATDGGDYFAVSCFRQISTDKLKALDTDTTRGTVQKAVCIITRTPTYGIINAKLKMVTEAYFNTKDLKNTSVLVELYEHLVKTFEGRSIEDHIHIGLDVGCLFMHHQHKPLQLFKTLLLGRTVMIYSPLAEVVCRSVLALSSLIPTVLASLTESLLSTSSAKNVYWRVQPYFSLQQMDDVSLEFTSKKLHLYGTANPLFERRHSELCDVFFNLKSGQLVVNDQLLQSSLSLTLADLRFTESLLTDKQKLSPGASSEGGTTWEGSDDYIREQFKRYLQSLYSVCETSDTDAQGDFNRDFVAAFRQSSVFYHISNNPAVLGLSARRGMVDVAHPSRGSLSLDDIKLRLTAQVRDLVTHDQLDQVKSAASNTSGRIAQVWTSVWNWWSPSNNDTD